MTGLTGVDVAARVGAGLTNGVSSASSRSLWQIVRANVLTLVNAIVGVSFVSLLVLGQWKDALFGLTAVGNAVIGVTQEYRAKRLLDRLAILESPHARVVRDGVIQVIDRGDVVRDDVLMLRVGDQVTADATILDSQGLEVDESLLTGESSSVAKGSGAEVLSGSGVVAGHGSARVVRVGAEAFANRISVEAKRFSLVSSEVRNGLNRVLRWVSWALLPLVLIVANGQMQARGGWAQAFSTGTWSSAVVGTIASVIGVIPFGLVLLTSVAFAVSAVRLARHKALIQELAAVEVLARVDVLCLDKTGTLTDGRIVFDATHQVGGTPPRGWHRALAWFGADVEANATAKCLAERFLSDGALQPVDSVGFTSVRRWSAVTFGADRAAGTWVLGPSDVVLGQDASHRDEAETVATALAATGLRTLVLAHGSTPPSRYDGRIGLPSDLVPVLVLTFRERVRPEAARTLAYFRDQGVALKIISGDDPRTVAAVARELGFEAREGYDARELPTDLDLMAEVLEEQMVFGRVTPAQKRELVLALRRRGHTIAMTGDGVNDALALKEADIGVTLDSAAAPAKAVSRLVLLDGRLDRLPTVVAEGRRVIANIERISILFLTKTVYVMSISLVFGALLWGFPFLSRQLSAVDGLTIGIPAFFLAIMANPRRYRPGLLRRSLMFAGPAGLIIGAIVVGLNVFSRVSCCFTGGAVQSSSVLVLSLVGLWILVVVARPVNLRRMTIIGAMYAGLVLLFTLSTLRDFFTLEWPPTSLVWASLVLSVAGGVAVEVVSRLQARRRL